MKMPTEKKKNQMPKSCPSRQNQILSTFYLMTEKTKCPVKLNFDLFRKFYGFLESYIYKNDQISKPPMTPTEISDM